MEFPSGDTEEQTRQALTNMGAILEEAGSSFKNGVPLSLSLPHSLPPSLIYNLLQYFINILAVVKVTVLLDDINDFTRVNDVYKTCK